mmetsp:Transcript_20209/g.28787  ORF Transcript_20209/g.28787 Transcript_20209/m.28787 type:complete len:217 (-) Transcript_20209:155-805(-)
MSKPQSSSTTSSTSPPLSVAFPANAYVELTIASPAGIKGDGGLADAKTQQLTSTIKGMVYTTDSTSNTVVLLRSLPNTTLHDVYMINASSILGCEALSTPSVAAAGTGTTLLSSVNSTQLEERERRAIRLATESLTQINTSATPRAQMIFDLLVKGCNVVSWGDENSIIVLNQVRVDPPYKPESCTWIGLKAGDKETKPLEEGSLERVKRIVGSRS